jgi:hypothetical protein
MTHRWYSPRLSRDIVSRLYHKAKAEGIPMTALVNQIVRRALDVEDTLELRTPDAGANGQIPQ